jgi:glycosyltransferase involved in cell wall biosynthesis
MKIGLDAKWYFRGPPSGRRVVRNLVRDLAELAGEDEIHLFLDKRSRNEMLGSVLPPERVHYVWSGNNQLSNLFVVSRAADRLGLDAVVYQNFVPPPVLAKHVRVALVYDAIFESNPAFFTPRERLYFAPLRYLTSTAERVCTISGTERDRLVRYRYAQFDRIDVMPMAADREFRRREHYADGHIERVLASLKVPERFVLFVGRLNVRKNLGTLVQAMQHVHTAGLSLVVVGAPDDTSPSLPAEAARGVRYLGSVPDAELRTLYAAATVFCYPSLDEGFGLCPLEAMTSGTPVIISNVPVLVETCGDAAVYIDPRDPVAIAAAIDALIDEPARCAALREAGFRRAAEFSWEHSARCLLASAHSAVENRA